MRFAAAYLTCVVLAACGPAQSTANSADVNTNVAAPRTPIVPSTRTVDDIDFTQYSTELANYTDLTLGQSRIAAIDVVRLLFAPEQGAKIIKTSTSEFDLEGGAVMLLSASELADDSVRAQEFYLIFEGDKGAQKLANYGLRVKCYRGENTTDWQTELCP